MAAHANQHGAETPSQNPLLVSCPSGPSLSLYLLTLLRCSIYLLLYVHTHIYINMSVCIPLPPDSNSTLTLHNPALPNDIPSMNKTKPSTERQTGVPTLTPRGTRARYFVLSLYLFSLLCLCMYAFLPHRHRHLRHRFYFYTYTLSSLAKPGTCSTFCRDNEYFLFFFYKMVCKRAQALT